MALSDVKYDAFISYRHSELDSFISENLHKKLENFKLPKSVIKKIGAEKTKIERVFRDEAELPLSDNLSDPITEALRASEFLIVICTPRLRESKWCRKEMETFVELHDRKHVLLVLAEGEPDESFPEMFLYDEVVKVDENGNEHLVKVEREYLAADCRGDDNRQRLKAMDNAVLKLCAAIFNLNYDDLKQRHRERAFRRWLIGMSCALSIITVFAFTCLFYSIKISKQKKVIEDKYASTMASVSNELLSYGLRKDALYAVRKVLPDKEAGGYNTDAYRALAKATAPYETERCFFPGEYFDVPLDAKGLALSDDHKYALVNGQENSTVIDIAENTVVKIIEDRFAVMCDAGVMYTNSDTQLVYSPIPAGEEIVLEKGLTDVYYSSGEKTALVFMDEGIAAYKGATKAFYLDFVQYGIDNDYTVDDVFISDDGKTAAFVIEGLSDNWIGTIDITAGELKMLVQLDYIDSPIVSCYDDLFFLCYEEEENIATNGQNTVMEVYGAYTGELKSKTIIPGYGFYEMKVGDDGILVISDTLSYVIDFDLTVINTITGYMDAMCTFSEEGGYVIMDGLGRLFCSGVYSGVDKIYSLYGHEENTMIGAAIYSDGCFYISGLDAGRVVKYSLMDAQYKVIEETFETDDETNEEIPLDNLQGIDDISIYFASISDDGKYIAVSSNDDTLYIFETASGKVVKEIYNSGILMSHKKFYYLDSVDMFVIENRVLDSDFNIISDLPRGAVIRKESDGCSVIMQSPYSLYTFYKITLLSYEEVLKKADEELDGYVPDQRIIDKYNM